MQGSHRQFKIKRPSYETPTVNIILSGGKLKTFPLRLGARGEIATLGIAQYWKY